MTPPAGPSGPGPSAPAGGPGVGAIAGVGIDAVDVPRFAETIRRRPGLVDRMFSVAEQEDARRSRRPEERLAARFAAKEAVMKALGRGLGSFALRDVEVVRSTASGSRAGAPSLRLGPGAAAVAKECSVVGWHVSLTHTATVAMAVVVAERAAGDAPGAP